MLLQICEIKCKGLEGTSERETFKDLEVLLNQKVEPSSRARRKVIRSKKEIKCIGNIFIRTLPGTMSPEQIFLSCIYKWMLQILLNTNRYISFIKF